MLNNNKILALSYTRTDGLISYSMPQGVRHGTEVDLTDRTYDGIDTNGFLTEGLGQLSDKQKGSDNFHDDLGNGKGI